MIVLLRCPMGHDATFTQSNRDIGEMGTETTIVCGQCGSIFVIERQVVTHTTGSFMIPIGQSVFERVYEKSGKWEGKYLTFITIDD